MKTKIIIAVLFVALIGAFFAFDLGQYFSLDYLKEQKEALNQFYNENPFLMLAIFFVVYVAMAALALPAATLLTVAGGALFGLWTGVIVVSFASTIGATLAFLLTRYLFNESIQSRFGDRLKVINDGIEREGAFYVFGLRLVPLFPFFVVNAVLGLTKLKTVTFYWASQLGMLAATVIYVNAGTQLAKINELSDIASPGLIASFVALGLFPIVAKKIMNFLERKKQPSAEA